MKAQEPDVLFYDSFTHSSHFNSEQTKNCGNDGCLLLITYENKDIKMLLS